MVIPILCKCSEFNINSTKSLMSPLQTPFNMLCNDMLEKILGYLDDEDALWIALTCRRFREQIYNQLKKNKDSRKILWLNWKKKFTPPNPIKTSEYQSTYLKVFTYEQAYDTQSGRIMNQSDKIFITSISSIVSNMNRFLWVFNQKDRRPRWLDPSHKNSSNTCALLAKLGAIDALKFLQKKNFSWDHRTCSFAASGGHLQLLQWARTKGCPWNINISNENYNSYRKLLFSEESRTKSESISSIFISRLDLAELGNACDYAAEGGYIDILKYAIANGCPFDELTCTMAARGGQLEILKYLRNELKCPWDYRTAYIAAGMGHLELLKWSIINKCEENDDCTMISILGYVAAEGGHLNVIKWLKEKKFGFDMYTCYYAASSGNIELFKLLVSIWLPRYDINSTDGILFCSKCANYITKGGNLEMLKWWRKQGTPYDYTSIICLAAKFGHLKMMKWMFLEHNYRSYELTLMAATYGHLELLKWLIAEGCPINEFKCTKIAAKYGRLDVCQWLLKEKSLSTIMLQEIKQSAIIQENDELVILIEDKMLV